MPLVEVLGRGGEGVRAVHVKQGKNDMSPDRDVGLRGVECHAYIPNGLHSNTVQCCLGVSCGSSALRASVSSEHRDSTTPASAIPGRVTPRFCPQCSLHDRLHRVDSSRILLVHLPGSSSLVPASHASAGVTASPMVWSWVGVRYSDLHPLVLGSLEGLHRQLGCCDDVGVDMTLTMMYPS
jgi:hypothetical protein